VAGDYDGRRLVEWLRAEIQRQTGRRYDRLDLDALDPTSLRRLLPCACCDMALSPASTRKNAKTYRYYRTIVRDKKGKGNCRARPRPAAAIEDLVVAMLREATTSSRRHELPGHAQLDPQGEAAAAMATVAIAGDGCIRNFLRGRRPTWTETPRRFAAPFTHSSADSGFWSRHIHHAACRFLCRRLTRSWSCTERRSSRSRSWPTGLHSRRAM
jgi:hypothetical protein